MPPRPPGTIREAHRTPSPSAESKRVCGVWRRPSSSPGSGMAIARGRARERGNDRSGDEQPSMDAKQVWRAALGELQVSLSPANYETWLKDTALVGVEGDRFRIAVPNGFAKDW